jgi:hypothetical protein
MQHINLDSQNAIIQQFFLALPGDPDGTIVELNGHAVARVVPVSPAPATGGAAESWTEAKNARRCTLIDREIDGTLTPAEAQELEQLQQQMLRYRRQVAPLPLEATRRLHEQLLARARQQTPQHP